MLFLAGLDSAEQPCALSSLGWRSCSSVHVSSVFVLSLVLFVLFSLKLEFRV